MKMNSYLHPRPLNNSLLWMERHRASSTFNKDLGSDVVLETRVNDQRVWDYIKSNPIPDAVMWYIRAAGFRGVVNCGYVKVDHALLTALAER